MRRQRQCQEKIKAEQMMEFCEKYLTAEGIDRKHINKGQGEHNGGTD